MNDILLDIDYDLAEQNGDFVCGDSTLQDAELIMISSEGHWINDLVIGADIDNFINDDMSLYDFKVRYKRHLLRDKKELTKFEIADKINIEVNPIND